MTDAGPEAGGGAGLTGVEGADGVPGLLGRILDCNRHDLAQFRPLRACGHRIGAVHRDFLPRLARFPDLVGIADDRVELLGASLTERLGVAMRHLYDEDRRGFGRWTGEAAPVLADWDGPVLFDVERAAHGLLGVKVRGVHVNGFVRGSGGRVRLWLARRSRRIAHHPGLLDQIAAGFLPSGIDPRRTAAEEAMAEAGIDDGLAAGLRPAGSISYCLQWDWNLVPGAVYIFDLALPPGFQPRNLDGEVEGFELLDLDEVRRRLERPGLFKFDCALVALDFLVRFGALDTGHPDYLRIVQGLHGRAPWDGALAGPGPGRHAG